MLSDDYDICIAYSLRPQTPQNFRDYFDSKVTLVKVKNFTRNINPLKDARAIGEIRHIAKEFKPDIIHLHSSKAGVLGRIAFNFSKEKLYYTPHGYSFLMQDASKIKRFVYWGIEKVIGFSRSTTISCSEGEFKESQKLTNNNELVNNGVDIDELQKLRSNFQCDDGENISIFTIGRISKQKNPYLFNEIAKKFPKIKFIWIGDGNLRSELTSKNIEVTGWLQRNEAIKLAMKSNFFILTSLWEGLPISLLESMFLGKECFVSNVIGNKDVIEDGVNGFICSDLSDFENKIKNLILNRKMGEKIAESARLDILKKYNTKVMASEYKKIYSSK